MVVATAFCRPRIPAGVIAAGGPIPLENPTIVISASASEPVDAIVVWDILSDRIDLCSA